MLTFSSETPVERWFGQEILDHTPEAVKLERINRGGALLLNHDRNQQIGVVLKAEITGDKKGKALVKFSRSAKAEEVFLDVIDGIRSNVSVGYKYHELKLEREKDDESVYRVTSWEPCEISLEAIPADPNVGVGRSLLESFDDDEAVDEPKKREAIKMDEEVTQRSGATSGKIDSYRDIAAQERARISEIMAIADKFSQRDLGQKAIHEGDSVEAFSKEVLKKMGSKPMEPLGLTKKESRQFSFLKAIRAATENNWKGAEFELEVSNTLSEKFNRSTNGFFVPTDVLFLETRDAMTTVANAAVIETSVPAGSFIDALRNKLVIKRLGAQVLSGLSGNLAIPRLAAGAKSYWVNENQDVGESPLPTDQVPLAPKSVGAFTDLSRRLILQTSVDIENLVRNDLAQAVALALDKAAISGQGKDSEPQGITGLIKPLDLASSGLSFNDVVRLETAVASSNADMGSLGYLTNAQVRGYLKTKTLNDAGAIGFCWTTGASGQGSLNGYPAEVTNAVTTSPDKSMLLFGNFADCLIGSWGILDVQTNPFIHSKSGAVRVRVLQDVDIAVRHAESFAWFDGIKTGGPAGPSTPSSRAIERNRG